MVKTISSNCINKLAYIDCNNLEQAQEALVQIGEYRLALTIAKQLKQSPQQIKLLAEKLVDTLKDQGQIKEAALLMKDFLNDCEGAVVILVEADYFFDAIHLVSYPFFSFLFISKGYIVQSS